MSEHTSQKGDAMVKVRYDIAEHPHEIYEFIAPEHPSHWMRKRAQDWCKNVFGEQLPDNQAILDGYQDATMPRQIAFSKKQGSRFWEVRGVE